MKKSKILLSFLGLFGIAVLFSSCSSAGVFPSAQITSIELTKGIGCQRS